MGIAYIILSMTLFSCQKDNHENYKTNSSLTEEFGENDLTREQFDGLSEFFGHHYRDLFQQLGGELNFIMQWEYHGKATFSAGRDNGTWDIIVRSNMFKKNGFTLDAIKLAICHEIGHHVAGFPFYKSQDQWGAVEGQADYYASFVCARKIWKNDPENIKFSNPRPRFKYQCDSVWNTEGDRLICYRTLEATYNLLSVETNFHNFVALRYPGSYRFITLPSFYSQSEHIVDETIEGSARSDMQCIYDTYLAGALCNKPYDNFTIPANEQESNQMVCNRASGDSVEHSRPLCWYKPKES